MKLQKVTFKNAEGQTLVGAWKHQQIDTPHNFAIFAHCFTCNKNLGAVKNISRGLSNSGFAYSDLILRV